MSDLVIEEFLPKDVKSSDVDELVAKIYREHDWHGADDNQRNVDFIKVVTSLRELIVGVDLPQEFDPFTLGTTIAGRDGAKWKCVAFDNENGIATVKWEKQ